ncbi:MAG TPA: molybdopterin-dependent oxidoreductase [Nitrososphaeraceae archaeon]|nr:molybdopterin-dependent oxidoreductase [Nitrososphaeraceae archaeon]
MVIEYTDFPYWIRFAHFINIIFITMLIRSGIEILSSLPKLYWKDDATPSTEWIKFTKKKDPPKDKLWISLEEEEDFSPLLALPGHKNLGLGRHWHFFSAIFWGLNGLIYYILLFTSNEWSRLIPTSIDIIPQAIQTALTYVTFNFPPPGNPYNPLQQLMYFGIVFLLGPFMVMTGAAMSPSISARFPRYPKIFGGRQAARSLHFLGNVAFILFIIIHVSMVVIEHFPENIGQIILGYPLSSWSTAIGLFALYIIVIAIIHIWITRISLNNPRIVQNSLDMIVNNIKYLFFRQMVSKQRFTRSDISPFFRVNGYPPDTKEYHDLYDNNFKEYKLKIFGLVESPIEVSISDLYNMQKQTQITEHFCIQGWTAIGEWAGVPMQYILELCRPLPKAKYVVFYSYQYTDNTQYYEAVDLEIVKHPQTILAYEMNGKKLDIGHGAPLRLRIETQLGYKMVKWLKSIEFVENYKHIGMGQGGHREDHKYYSARAGI